MERKRRYFRVSASKNILLSAFTVDTLFPVLSIDFAYNSRAGNSGE